MTEITAADFDRLCQTGPVQAQITSLDATRKAALRQFWMFALIGGALTLALTGVALATYPGLSIIVLVIGGVATLVLANRPLEQAKKGLKLPVLEALAGQTGVTYTPLVADPPGFEAAQKALFGGYLSDTTFTDLFKGVDSAGREFAVYEADLERGSGKNKQQVFRGQVYAFARKAGDGVTVIVPDRGLFNFFKPGKGMERVKLPDHPEFEKRFEVYSTAPAQAEAQLAAVNVRERLLELRAKGQLFAYIAPDAALFAITGKDRFEPGGMMKGIGGHDRVRLMFDDVCASIAVMKDLKATWG